MAEMRWKGYLNIDSVAVPCSSSGLEKTPGKLFSDDNVHKYGWVINYADGQNAYAGSVDFPLTDELIAKLGLWVTGTDNVVTYDVVLSPDGTTAYNYDACYLNTLTLTGNLGGVSTGSADLAAVTRGTTGSVPDFDETAGATTNINPIPYWKTQIAHSSWTTNDVTAWSITINRNPAVVYTFDGTNDPNQIQYGTVDVTGSVTVVGGAVPTDGSAATLTIGSVAPSVWTLRYLVFTGYPAPIGAPNEKMARTYEFRVIGDETYSPVEVA